MMDSGKIHDRLISEYHSYGYLPFLFLIRVLESMEEYSHCASVKKMLDEVSRIEDIEIPDRWSSTEVLKELEEISDGDTDMSHIVEVIADESEEIYEKCFLTE